MKGSYTKEQYMNEGSLVSIIVPIYNAEKFIERFMSFILAQDYQNWELIIVDDGSIDASVALVEKAMKQDSRIKLYKRNRNPKGSTTCRNIGQQAVKGDFFIHLDCDDIIAPYLISQRVKFMLEHPEIDYSSAHGRLLMLHENGDMTDCGEVYGVDPHKDLLLSFLDYTWSFSVWNNIYRTSSFKNYYWDEKVKIRTDFSYIIPAIISGYKHAFIEDSKYDYFYVKGINGSISSDWVSQEKHESTMRLFKKTLNQIDSLDHSAMYKRAFRSYFNHQLAKLSTSGSAEQVHEFYRLYLSCYKEKTNLRLRLLYWLVLSRKNRFHDTTLKIIIYAFIDPKRLLKFGMGKLRKKTSKTTKFVLPLEWMHMNTVCK